VGSAHTVMHWQGQRQEGGAGSRPILQTAGGRRVREPGSNPGDPTISPLGRGDNQPT